jgi:hypothetical protein
VRAVDYGINRLFLAARAGEFTWVECGSTRVPAEPAFERFIEAVRAELSLPPSALAIHIADVTT